jgi:hypothetical protein
MNVELQVNEANPLLFIFRKFDKRQNLPFSYTSYIKFHSNRAVNQAYNIVISQLLTILYISDYDTTAIDEIKILVSTMCTNGFQRTRLMTIIKHFCKKDLFQVVKWTHKILFCHLPIKGITPLRFTYDVIEELP